MSKGGSAGSKIESQKNIANLIFNQDYSKGAFLLLTLACLILPNSLIHFILTTKSTI
jgi:hypothetical protein